MSLDGSVQKRKRGSKEGWLAVRRIDRRHKQRNSYCSKCACWWPKHGNALNCNYSKKCYVRQERPWQPTHYRWSWICNQGKTHLKHCNRCSCYKTDEKSINITFEHLFQKLSKRLTLLSRSNQKVFDPTFRPSTKMRQIHFADTLSSALKLSKRFVWMCMYWIKIIARIRNPH